MWFIYSTICWITLYVHVFNFLVIECRLSLVPSSTPWSWTEKDPEQGSEPTLLLGADSYSLSVSSSPFIDSISTNSSVLAVLGNKHIYDIKLCNSRSWIKCSKYSVSLDIWSQDISGYLRISWIISGYLGYLSISWVVSGYFRVS